MEVAQWIHVCSHRLLLFSGYFSFSLSDTLIFVTVLESIATMSFWTVLMEPGNTLLLSPTILLYLMRAVFIKDCRTIIFTAYLIVRPLHPDLSFKMFVYTFKVCWMRLMSKSVRVWVMVRRIRLINLLLIVWILNLNLIWLKFKIWSKDIMENWQEETVVKLVSIWEALLHPHQLEDYLIEINWLSWDHR